MAVFGRTFTVSFSARDGEKTVPVSTLSGARVYSSAPTNEQIADVGDTLSASVVTEVTSWTDGLNDNEKLVTFGKITDASPYSTVRYETYYVVINFKYESSGDVCHTVKQVLMYRPDALTSRFGVEADDIYTIESAFEDVKGAQWLAEKIVLAEELVEKDLQGQGFELRRLKAEDARNLVIWKTAMLGVNDLSSDSTDVWADKYERHTAEYNRLKKSLPIRYDYDDSGAALPTEIETVRSVSFGRGN